MTSATAKRSAAKRHDSTPIRVLVVDDNDGIRGYLANLLELQGYRVDTAEDGRRALALIQGGADPDVVLLDVMMPGIDGLETLRRIRDFDPKIPVVMLSVVGKATTIVEAMRLGAANYLNKPFEEEELEVTLEKILEARRLQKERDTLRSVMREAEQALWSGPALLRVQAVIRQIADTDVTVLIQGESGTGKEVVARAVHATSARRARPFIKVNCAALPSELLESELFGYERGAFTGAVARKVGKFELADTGTIFLDEIGEMSPALQAKLLQVLQDASFSRLGGNRELRVNVRIVTATNRALPEMVQSGAFREDLYFRLNVVSLELPPLRERRNEVSTLLELFLKRYAARYGRVAPAASPRLLKALERHPFPGNIRELENMAKRIVVLGSEEPILQEIAHALDGGGGQAARGFEVLLRELEASAGKIPLKEVARRAALEAERGVLLRVLFQNHWNRRQAAAALNVSYKTLLQRIRDCGIEVE